MKFLPRVGDPSLFSSLPGTQFPVSMVHSDYTMTISCHMEVNKRENNDGSHTRGRNFIIYSCLCLYYVVKELYTNL
jgi:hypothetical protein